MSSGVAWRGATPDDLDAIMAIQDEVHRLLPERREVVADKMLLFPEGSLVLCRGVVHLGYGIAHPWTLGDIPRLDTRIATLPPAPDCLFIHDVAVLPQARGQGAAAAFVTLMASLARALGYRSMALVSVYGTARLWQRHGFETVDEANWVEQTKSYGSAARYMSRDTPNRSCKS